MLSPAHAGGTRARFLLNPRATFALAREFHAQGLPLSAVFAFASGLYFRGKITYAERFASEAAGDVVRVITSNAGLVDPRMRVGPAELAAFGATEIEAGDPAYHRPLRRAARGLRRRLGPAAEVVLLGSIATPKYRDVLLEIFGGQLLFPSDFVGRGDMSRGALLLRAARAGEELPYATVRNAVLTGRRASGAGRKAAGRG
ncbi:MAG: hypothetical protein JWM88_2801 [Verrucomicrobia bacterium]|nr:hypothetical protein [Verrucomicrobiota bacterium]